MLSAFILHEVDIPWIMLSCGFGVTCAALWRLGRKEIRRNRGVTLGGMVLIVLLYGFGLASCLTNRDYQRVVGTQRLWWMSFELSLMSFFAMQALLLGALWAKRYYSVRRRVDKA